MPFRQTVGLGTSPSLTWSIASTSNRNLVAVYTLLHPTRRPNRTLTLFLPRNPILIPLHLHAIYQRLLILNHISTSTVVSSNRSPVPSTLTQHLIINKYVSSSLPPRPRLY